MLVDPHTHTNMLDCTIGFVRPFFERVTLELSARADQHVVVDDHLTVYIIDPTEEKTVYRYFGRAELDPEGEYIRIFNRYGDKVVTIRFHEPD